MGSRKGCDEACETVRRGISIDLGSTGSEETCQPGVERNRRKAVDFVRLKLRIRRIYKKSSGVVDVA